jgi:cytochrome P450
MAAKVASSPYARGGAPAARSHPPGPPGLPFLGNLLGLARDPLAFYTDCAERYGDIVGMRLGGWPALLLNDPDDIESVLVKQHRSFVRNSFFWRHVTAVFGSGLLTSEGALWQRQRRLAAPAFTGPRLTRYGETMVAHTGAMLDTWKVDEIRDVHADMMVLTLRIAAESLFGAVVEEDVETIKRDGDAITREIAARFTRLFVIPDIVPLPGHLRYRRGIRRLEAIVARILRQRRADPEAHNDLLSNLMQARDETGQPMPDRQLRDEVLTMLLAGQETTALALTWSWYLIGQHPEVDARLGAEVEAVLGGRAPTIGDLPRLRYTGQVITEAMRLFPPAWALGREAAVDCEIGGYPVPKGTTLFICPWILHRSARFFDEPAAFRPERWEGSLARDLPRFAYLPFGGGPRICIGNRFALMEASLVLATVAQRFSLTWQASRPVVPLPSITLRPDGGVWVKLAARAGTPAGANRREARFQA